MVYASPKPETWGIDWVTRSGKTIWVHYKCADELFEAIRRIQNASEATEDNPLTHEQIEVLQLIADGAIRREIAAKLSISHYAIRGRMERIFVRLNAVSASNAVAIGVREGIIK